MFALIAIGVAVAMLLSVVVVAMVMWGKLRRQSAGFGYPSVLAYFRAVPRSDAEKRAAVSLALGGVVICVLGLIFPPFLLVGLVPLFYGGRKVAWASMGLGLVDDADQPAR